MTFTITMLQDEDGVFVAECRWSLQTWWKFAEARGSRYLHCLRSVAVFVRESLVVGGQALGRALLGHELHGRPLEVADDRVPPLIN
jgi:hypothetical protein